jgi:hypothetical protein
MPFQECNPAMAQFNEMFKRQLGGMPMIKDDVGDTFIVHVPGDRDSRHLKRVGKIEIYGDDSFRAALQQESGVFVKELGIMAVHAGDKEVALLPGAIFNARDH